ncbi:hypothetical protein ACFO5K_18570 [Nocardia halotolerans]|uniref:Uncharacterized protein n=1 Tax=Nocardia halotolerans TaxID=1755878 RepID=A0ABV8VJ73_9NOCA
MQSPRSPLPTTTASGTPEATPAVVSDDRELVVNLLDPHMRALCASAAGLSGQALLRLAAAAETLRQTEGLEAAARTAQL